MSLEQVAKHIAAKGRNGDSVLMHVHPREVAGLQALAKMHGKTLTVNPETGLPEAFSLKSILPALAGAAAGFFTMNPYVGAGVSAAMTKGMGGSDRAALLSGLGSYFGGANMGANLGGAAAEGAASDVAVQGVGEAALPDMAGNALMPPDVAQMAAQNQGLAMDMGAGAPAATAGPEAVGPEWQGSYTDTAGQQVAGNQPPSAYQTDAQAWDKMPARDQLSRTGDVSFDQWKDRMGGWGGVGKSGIAALATDSALENVDKKLTPQKVKMGIQEYKFDPQMQRVVPTDSREYKHFGNEFTKGAYRDVSAASGGIMRLAEGGSTSGVAAGPTKYGAAAPTGGYKPEQVYGAGASGGYNPQAVYGAQATMPQATQAAQIPNTPGTMAPQVAPGTQKFMFDPKTGGFSINPAWQTAQDAAAKAAAAAQAAQDAQQQQQNYGGTAGESGGSDSFARGGIASLGDYSDGGRLLRGPGDGVSDSIPAHIDGKRPARLADGEFVVPARAVSELGNGSTEAGSKKLYGMLDRIQRARGKTTGKNGIAKKTNADKLLPA